MKETGLWFCDYNKKYEGPEPFFYPVKKMEVAHYLEQNYSALHSELKMLWDPQSNNITDTFGSYDSFDDKQFPPRSWQKMVFKVWGIRNKKGCNKFRYTAALIDKFPTVTSCFVTKTSPHSIIKPHCGETNAHIRIHLGLHVPEVESSVCGMEVGNQTVSWQNGKTFAFLDAHNHHVWNNSDEDRYVLIVDTLRPEFTKRRNFICARIIVSQIYFSLANKISPTFLFDVPSVVLDVLTRLFYVPIRMVILMNNKISFTKF
jgi:aspartyl/asparaginyl beta-hydroxylase (cupin superfamily)